MHPAITISLLVLFGVASGVTVYNTMPVQTITELEDVAPMTVTVIQTPEETAEQAAIQKILDENFAESVVHSWWRHANGTTTVRGTNKSNGMFDAVYDQKLGTLSLTFDRDLPSPK